MFSSLLWEYFVKAEGGTATCKKCLKTFQTKSGNTSSLRKHLQSMHKEQFVKIVEDEKVRKEKSEEAKNEKRDNSVGADQGTSKMKQPRLDFSDRSEKYPNTSEKQKKFDHAIVDFLADTFIPFNVTGQDSFKKLFDIADKRLAVKDRTTYSRMVDDSSKNILSQVCRIIAHEKDNILSVGLTTDLWTSRSGDAHMSLTVSWIDPDWNMLRFTPFVKPFPGRHTGVRISLQLDDMIDDLDFNVETDKVCVCDNASNMKVAIAKSFHVREYFCNIHTLQLGVIDTFKNVAGMKSVLDKCKDVAKFCHQSTCAMEQLRAAAKRKDIPFRKPQNPGKTRWDSQHETMKSIFHLKPALEDLEITEPDWEDKSLSKTDWKLLRGAINLLETFRDTTKIWQFESIPTVNLVIDRVFCMEEELKTFINDARNDQFGITFAKELMKNLEKRFPNHGLEVFERRAANYLDPHFKGIHLRKFKYFDTTRDEIERGQVDEDDDQKASDQENSMESTGRNNNDAAADEEMSPTARLRLELEAIEPRDAKTSKIRAEMAVFEKIEIAPKSSDVLQWWKNHEKSLPLLSKFAKKVLAIPASSGKSERVFSTGGNFVTAKRTRLNPSKVQSLIVLKENKKQVEQYLFSHGIEKLPETDTKGEKAFEKVKIQKQIAAPNSYSEDEKSSDDEYYLDED